METACTVLLVVSWLLGAYAWHVARPRLKAEKKRKQDEEQEQLARSRAEVKAKQDREETEARRRKQHADEQERIRHALTQLVSNTHATVELLPASISHAEASLDRAEEEFKDGAYVPFWDAVEKAVRSLADYDGGIRLITSNSGQIPTEIKKLDNPPHIDLSKFVWPDAVPTIKRMNQIVRLAQKNKDFTTIFLQIRTNQILDVGFANLGSAIEDMGSRIQGSISTLTQAVDSGMSAIREQQASIAETERAQRDAIAKEATEQRNEIAEAQHERDDIQTEMLDNMQRRRIPLPKKYCDGQY